MNSQNYWAYFLETGAPEAYVLFNMARRMEEENVSHNPGVGAPDNRI